MNMVSACYILSYYSPDYVRTRTIVKALEQIKDVRLFQARNTSTGLWRYFETLGKLLKIRLLHNPQYYILGFRGYELFWLIRFITLGKPLFFDHMMSPYDSLVNESHRVGKHSFLARMIYLYERSILLASDLIFTDTEVHRSYFQSLFHLAPAKVQAIPVGADEQLFHPLPASLPSSHAAFEVLFYGSFLPLHGMDFILKAASTLRNKPIHFTLIGGNRLDLSSFRRSMEDLCLANVTHIDWVDFEELPQQIARANLGLGGPFGNTGQAQRVITGKTFQFLAMAKPVVIGEINQDCGFMDKHNCLLVPQGDEAALAGAISWAFDHKAELERIGHEGHELYLSRYSTAHISDILRTTLLT